MSRIEPYLIDKEANKEQYQELLTYKEISSLIF